MHESGECEAKLLLKFPLSLVCHIFMSKLRQDKHSAKVKAAVKVSREGMVGSWSNNNSRAYE